MGTDGMRASLISREVIADSIELVARGYNFDGLIALCGCDKTIPGTTMALARLGIPGPRALRRLDCARRVPRTRRHDPGRVRGRRRPRGRPHERRRPARHRGPRLPGSGACGGQFTANTMATAVEFLGVAPDGQRFGAGDRPGEGGGRPARRRARDGSGPAATCCRARSSRARRSRTRSPPSPAPADRPTPCCTCSRSRARSA